MCRFKCLRELEIHCDTQLFTIFAVAKIWKQSRCLLTDKQVKKMGYTCHEKEENPIVRTTWMDFFQGITLSEVSQRKGNTARHHRDAGSKLKSQTHRNREEKWLPGAREGERKRLVEGYKLSAKR